MDVPLFFFFYFGVEWIWIQLHGVGWNRGLKSDPWRPLVPILELYKQRSTSYRLRHQRCSISGLWLPAPRRSSPLTTHTRPAFHMGCQLPTSTHYPQVPTSTNTCLLHIWHNYMLLMNSSACTLILIDVQLYKYRDFFMLDRRMTYPLHLCIPSAFMFYLRISAAHKLFTRVSYQLLQPVSIHVGRIYPRFVGMRVQKGHLYPAFSRDHAADLSLVSNNFFNSWKR